MLTTPEGVKFKVDDPWSKFDHQLWFCPLAETKHMFTGYWANEKEQDEHQKKINERLKSSSAAAEWNGLASGSDLRDARSCVVKTPRGYRAEFFIPGERFLGWEGLKPGAEVGLALTLLVEDLKNSQHELYWPNPKKEGAMKKPWTWARVKLAE